MRKFYQGNLYLQYFREHVKAALVTNVQTFIQMFSAENLQKSGNGFKKVLAWSWVSFPSNTYC